MTKKRLTLLICLALALSLFTPVDAAHSVALLELGDEIPMPNNIGFEIHDTCWEHDWFVQYHVRSDGWFVVLHRVANLHSADKEGFGRVYVDIYNSVGVFQKELSLNSADATVARITETAVEIYLPNCYLSYDLETEAVTCHYMPSDCIQNSDLYDLQWQTEMQIGEWTYKSKGLPNMYNVLTREKEGNVEIILRLKGSSLSFPNIIPYVLCSVITILAFWYIMKRKHKTK